MIINCAYNLPHICNIILVAYYCYAVQWLLWWMLITHIHKIYLQYSNKKLKNILDEKFRTLCFKNVQLNFQSCSAFQTAIIIYCGIYETQRILWIYEKLIFYCLKSQMDIKAYANELGLHKINLKVCKHVRIALLLSYLFKSK